LRAGTGKTVVFASLLRYVSDQLAAAGAGLGAGDPAAPGGLAAPSTPAGGGGPRGDGDAALAPGPASEAIAPPPAATQPLQPPGPGALRVLLLVHRSELMAQALRTLRLVWPGAAVSVLSARSKDLSGQVGGQARRP
jgi:hypothetical protein